MKIRRNRYEEEMDIIFGHTGTDSGAGRLRHTVTGGRRYEKEDTQTAGDAKTEEVQTVRLGVMTGNSDHWVAEVGTEQGIFENMALS